MKGGQIPDLMGLALIDAAAEQNVLTDGEADVLREYDRKIMEIINVDDFDFAAFSRA